MIGKKDGGQRPISVGQVYRSLAGRCLVKVYKAETIQALGANQTAMQSNGTTKTAMAIQTHLEQHPEFIAMALDAKNAFNSVDREIMLEQNPR